MQNEIHQTATDTASDFAEVRKAIACAAAIAPEANAAFIALDRIEAALKEADEKSW